LPAPSNPLQFDEAVRWFRAKVSLTRPEWNELSEAARQRAFTVSDVAQLDLVADVWKAIDHAVAQGTTLQDFKDTIGQKLKAEWAGTVENPGWRLETIFRTNIQSAYASGRYEQATDPDVVDERPYWMFDAIMDSRTTPICEECDGTILPADDPWWKTHLAPLHFNCRSGFTTLTRDQAEAMGIAPQGPSKSAQTGFGAVPELASVPVDRADYPSELWNASQEKKKP